ncbi:DUF5597 domain-containing protein [Actinokineospora soli]|uniref:DUF5597 domain-containing protein n=1 Tax=Actinokineospora soli TaxID=1048753 RepID=A0ABW2TSQ1_9PSEU
MKHSRVDATTGRLIVDGEPYLIRGVELHNSTSSSADYLAPVWPRCTAASVNTVLAAVSWELVEPEEGTFDFGLVDAMLAGAREHGLRLVLLWFGSWKNGSSSYTPSWVKLDPDRFPLQLDAAGEPLDNLSPFNDDNRDADAAAFAAFMAHLAAVDGAERTVVMVQVENEVGLLGAARSHGGDAWAAWDAPVPSALVAALRDGGSPHVGAPADVADPSWGDLVGDDDRKAELFMAWHYAAYVEHVAAAGSVHHDVPLFVNAWLDAIVPEEADPAGIALAGGSAPGVFPSGGPLPHVAVAWRLAAPSIAFLAPDVYFGDFEVPFKAYAETNPTLFVPEMRADAHGVSHTFLAIGGYGAIGVSPFGFDSLREEDTLDLRRTYTQLAALEAEILAAQPAGRVRGFRVAEDDEVTLSLGGHDFSVQVDTGSVGYGLLLQLDDGAFIAAGTGFSLRFPQSVAVLSAEELVIDDARLVPQRRLNGDETMAGTRIRVVGTPSLMHGFMLTTGTLSGVVRFSLYRREVERARRRGAA